MALRIARLDPAGGILFAVLVLVAELLTRDVPGSDASDAQVVAYFADDGNRNKAILSFFLVAVAVLAFLSFLGSLRGALARSEGEPARLTTTATTAGGVFIALAAAAHVAGTAVAFAADDIDAFRVDANTARLFWALSFWFFVMSLFAAAAMTLAAALLALQTAALPRWLAYGGLVATAGGVLGILAWPSVLVLAWIVAVAAWLLARGYAASPPRGSLPPGDGSSSEVRSTSRVS
jgi:Domain of unknown function (DUF4386)